MTGHDAVLLTETIAQLKLRPGDTAIDATCGAGGHSEAIATAIGPDGILIAIDQDEAALEKVKQRIGHHSQIRFVHGNFRTLDSILGSFAIEHVNAICADLGVASFHFDDLSRGFSFRSEVELDARMDRRQSLTAAKLLATASEKELGRIFREYGEETRWRAMAAAVVKARQESPSFTGTRLREIARGVKGRPRRGDKAIDPSTQVLQALRVAVNDELGALRDFLPAVVTALAPAGRVAVIAYHSLEDRIVKQFFRDEEKGCQCPPTIPRCVCGRKPTLRRVTRKPTVPSEAEIQRNPRSRSAKLRVAERI
ncbi:MAG: 16S rRNA (cytosine(1402)-N(4))-methyltransferase RsmH [Candidatus Lernaella stagnicola]|nr:16S rRNA (cytosine(1402)-N(4))-methyltransferase RsmH [Candidatus Lernaella stagnicola]